jgi:hypothetical protein
MNAPQFRAEALLKLPLAVSLVGYLATSASGADRPDIAPQLRAGELAAAEELLAKHLAAESGDDLARFQLGTVQFVRAAERLAQDGVRYGTLSRTMMLPFIRVGGLAAGNKKPEPATYADVRAMIERFQTSIMAAEATLAPIQSKDLAWKLDLRDVRLDLNGDGQRTETESLGALFQMVAVRRRWDQSQQPPLELVVGFDSADVYWLRGYCHLLSSLADMILAHDEERLFELTAHTIFADPQTEFAKRRDLDISVPSEHVAFRFDELSDVIAVIHLINFQVEEPARLKSAHEHLLKMIELSRSCWELILAEQDNDHEWIPGPTQKSVIPDLLLDREQVEAWRDFLDEAKAILVGKKLIPFWRHGFKEGVNLQRVFTDPRPFDLVLWVQGTSALPYLEAGEQTSPETWQRFQRIFRGEFVGIAIWVN